MGFIKGQGDWRQYRELGSYTEVDFHRSDLGPREIEYEEAMDEIRADALEALTGERELDATAIRDYFAPLQAWLDEQNADRSCGW